MLSILSSIYAKVAAMRNALYNRGVFDVFDTRARTISIGNITAGGTGKTPLVAYVARVLAERGEKVCILTRGYGRSDPGNRVVVSDGEKILTDPLSAGDEPFELAQKLLGKASVVADADRISAAEMAHREMGITAFVLDDGFQHRKVKRDLDIVCIDAADPFGGRMMLPAGRLREPIHNLNRADVVVITRTDQVTDTNDLEAEIRELSPNGRLFRAKNVTARTLRLSDFLERAEGSRAASWGHFRSTFDREGKSGLNVIAFCALGNPKSFFAHLRSEFEGADGGLDLFVTKPFPDHYRYTQQDIDDVQQLGGDSSKRILVTSAKDAVKLRGLNVSLPCFVVEIEVVVENADEFEAML